jgi:hypothetical protein
MANEFKIKKGLIVTGADGGTVVDIQGSQGQLFSVTDDLSGSIFAVSDISGVPILDVNSSGLSTFDGDVNIDGSLGVGTSSPQGKLSVKAAQYRQLDFIESNSLMTIRSTAPDASYNLRGFNVEANTISLRTGATSGIASAIALTLDATQNATFAGFISTPSYVYAGGGVRVPYAGASKMPMIVLNGAITYGLFHTEASNDIFSFDFAGASKHSFDQLGNATFAGSITAGTNSKFQVLGSGYIQLGNCTISASGDNNHIHVTCPTALIPNGTTLANNTRLGTAAYRWKDFYSGPGNFEGSVTASADVIAYSDARLKENVKTLDGSKVLKMRGVSFDRKDNGASSSGVIAQEMQKVAPELVSDDNGTLGVAYGNLTGYLIEAIKEQQKQINELKSQMNTCNKTNCNCNCKN